MCVSTQQAVIIPYTLYAFFNGSSLIKEHKMMSASSRLAAIEQRPPRHCCILNKHQNTLQTCGFGGEGR